MHPMDEALYFKQWDELVQFTNGRYSNVKYPQLKQWKHTRTIHANI